MQGRVEPLASSNPYKCLAEAVLIQAIKDATHEYRRRKKTKKTLRDMRGLQRSKEASVKASHFLLKDSGVFSFWCQVAELRPEVVRARLKRQLRKRSTYIEIRRHQGGKVYETSDSD